MGRHDTWSAVSPFCVCWLELIAFPAPFVVGRFKGLIVNLNHSSGGATQSSLAGTLDLPSYSESRNVLEAVWKPLGGGSKLPHLPYRVRSRSTGLKDSEVWGPSSTSPFRFHLLEHDETVLVRSTTPDYGFHLIIPRNRARLLTQGRQLLK
ncbi:uncharacterized protein BO96DRAFT_100371 [Aspergillus niger CBS 101883]|uniref:uncharacterized protein n=1 Tax=Aspergillus lacticoffeatus (strain CBS 101883) TaxID=1450533 RepID=UPI000D7F82F4|nr:uncharacterized protein BO96DRAFT_100371 [Aspergillus niger CBS 101883]PYH61576.1 hypothetical protein BO96DRAFT_100371 [Aspergillus niger CBS 101883]